MRRRQLLALGAGTAVSALLGSAVWAAGSHTVPYSAQAFAKLKASGEPVLLDFYAPW